MRRSVWRRGRLCRRRCRFSRWCLDLVPSVGVNNQIIHGAADKSLTSRQRGPMVAPWPQLQIPARQARRCATRARPWIGGSGPGSGRDSMDSNCGKGPRPGDPGDRAVPGSDAEAGASAPHHCPGARIMAETLGDRPSRHCCATSAPSTSPPARTRRPPAGSKRPGRTKSGSATVSPGAGSAAGKPPCSRSTIIRAW